MEEFKTLFAVNVEKGCDDDEFIEENTYPMFLALLFQEKKTKRWGLIGRIILSHDVFQRVD